MIRIKYIFSSLLILFIPSFFASFCYAGQVFNLRQLPTDLEMAKSRLSQWKNSGQLELVPRPPATLVLVSPQFWRKLSMDEKARVVRDCLYFGRFYNEHHATGITNCSYIFFNRKNPAEELGWGNLIPGDIIIFK
jgi:hypothetical protein